MQQLLRIFSVFWLWITLDLLSFSYLVILKMCNLIFSLQLFFWHLPYSDLKIACKFCKKALIRKKRTKFIMFWVEVTYFHGTTCEIWKKIVFFQLRFAILSLAKFNYYIAFINFVFHIQGLLRNFYKFCTSYIRLIKIIRKHYHLGHKLLKMCFFNLIYII